MALIDDLAGILGSDAVDRIRAAGLASRIERGDELVTTLDSGVLPEPRTANVAGPTLEELTKSLEASFTAKAEEIAQRKAEAVWAERAGQATTSVLADATRWAHQMSQIEREHERVFGEPFDDKKLQELNEYARSNGRRIESPKQIYDEWTRERRTEIEIERRADAKAKEKISSRSVPGVSPSSAAGVRAALHKFASGAAADGRSRAEKLNDMLAGMEQAS